MDRRTVLWALVAFFGASIAFSAVNRATEGEPALLRLGLQLAVLAAIIALIVVLVRRQG
jgi:hypothetical protein